MSSDLKHALANSTVFDVSQLTAVVSGGGTGIGLMIAETLCANGAKVYIIGRRKEALDNVVKQYGSKGPGKIIALPGDISNKDDLKRIAEEVTANESQGIQLLVNNAGVARDDNTKFSSNGQPDMKSAQAIQNHFWQSPADSWAETFGINVTGHFFTSLAFLPLLEKGHSKIQGYTSSIVNIASISGVMKSASGGQFAYAASKAASLHLTKMMANQFIGTKVRVNAIAPGLFPSEMTTGTSDESQKSSIDRKVGNPAGRAGSEQDMAASILFLAGPGGVFFNSQIIYPDGGATLMSPASN